jgi:hypothetical protein
MLTYANVQMAAEAIFPTGFIFGPILESYLTRGNDRNSRFPATLAKEFASEWEIVDHRPNSGTGFSGTLFEYTGETDPIRGLVKGERVVSLRSTEFVDDAARDSKANNELEIRDLGFAFGQIADMKAWFDQLNTDVNKLKDKPFTLTGYSLGVVKGARLDFFLTSPTLN